MYKRIMSIVIFACLLIVLTLTALPAAAQGSVKVRSFILVPSVQLASCFPNAQANITLLETGDLLGVDQMTLRAQGLPPNTKFELFLTEIPHAPYRAVSYVANFTTDDNGRGSVQVNGVITEAFAFSDVTGIRAQLDHVVFWFDDRKDAQKACNIPTVTPFNPEGMAGVVAMSSRNFPDDAGPLK